MVVTIANSREETKADYGVVIEDVRSLIVDNQNRNINFIFREANNVAHLLAKFSISLSEKKVWIEDEPLQIIPSILKEKYCND